MQMGIKMIPEEEEEEIVIVGGGICGLATALALHRKGIRSIIVERSESVRAAGVGIIMQPNGWRALHQLGVASNLRKTALYLPSGDFVSVEDGRRRDLGLGKGELRCLKRMDLIKALADELPKGTVYLGCNVVSVSNHPLTLRPLLHLQDGTIIKPKILIGCDGLNSKVAKYLGIPSAKLFTRCATRGFTYYQKCHNYGDTFRIFSSENAQLGLLPVTDTLIYWFLTRPLNPDQDSGSSKKDQNFIKDTAVEAVKNFPEHAVELIKKSDLNSLYLTELWYRTPYDILTSSFNKGNVAVAGDAMHAMCPFISQGGGASLEDAVVLARNLSHKLALMERGYKGGSMIIEEALAEYVKERRMRLLWLSVQTYLIGLTLSQSKLKKFLGILGLIFIIRDPKTHTDYDCGQL